MSGDGRCTWNEVVSIIRYGPVANPRSEIEAKHATQVQEPVRARWSVYELEPDRALQPSAPIRRVTEKRPSRGPSSEAGRASVGRVGHRSHHELAVAPHVGGRERVECNRNALGRMGQRVRNIVLRSEPARMIERQLFSNVGQTFIEECVL